MKRFVQFLVGCAILALVKCAPVYDNELELELLKCTQKYDNQSDRRAYTLINTRSISPDGNYYYKYSLTSGVTQEVKGTLKEINGVKFYSVRGLYVYRAVDGKTHTIEYIADENGYRILSHKIEEVRGAVINPKALVSLLAR